MATAKLAEPQNWPSMTVAQLNGLELTLATAWMDGKVLYRFKASPASALESTMNAARSSLLSTSRFTILFYDRNGFKILEISVPLTEFARIVDDKNAPTDFEAEDWVDCSSDVYQRITQFNVRWNFRM